MLDALYQGFHSFVCQRPNVLRSNGCAPRLRRPNVLLRYFCLCCFCWFGFNLAAFVMSSLFSFLRNFVLLLWLSLSHGLQMITSTSSAIHPAESLFQCPCQVMRLTSTTHQWHGCQMSIRCSIPLIWSHLAVNVLAWQSYGWIVSMGWQWCG